MKVPLPIKTVPYYLSKKEYIDAIFPIPAPWKYLVIPVYGALIGCAVAWSGEVKIGATAGGILVLYGVLAPWFRLRSLQQYANNPNSKWFFAEVRTDQFFSDYLVMEVANGVSSRVPLKLIHKAEVKKGCLLLSLGNQKLVVPLRAMGTAQNRAEIAELLSGYGLSKSDKVKAALERGA